LNAFLGPIDLDFDVPEFDSRQCPRL
jgi:hypothetical protein